MSFHPYLSKFGGSSCVAFLEVISDLSYLLVHYFVLAYSCVLLADFISTFANFMLQSAMKN